MRITVHTHTESNNHISAFPPLAQESVRHAISIGDAALRSVEGHGHTHTRNMLVYYVTAAWPVCGTFGVADTRRQSMRVTQYCDLKWRRTRRRWPAVGVP